jgi:ribosomal protein L11 methyltransferase
MAVVELKAEIAPGAVPALEELLAEREEQRLMVTEDKPSGRAWLTGYFATADEAKATWNALAGQIDPEWLATEPEVRELPDTDWKESYKAHFKAWHFGPLHWVPIWERESFKRPAGAQVLWLDPGMAFGTGNHETTRLCCERLVQHATVTQAHGRVIDAGCGSGILALSAIRLGYTQVTAFDSDPVAIDVSRENAKLNDLTGRVDFFVGDLVTGLARRQAELVLANIQSDVLIKFCRALLGSVAPGGTLALSGILERELMNVRMAFAAAAPGWSIDSRVMGEWADLALTRK